MPGLPVSYHHMLPGEGAADLLSPPLGVSFVLWLQRHTNVQTLTPLHCPRLLAVGMGAFLLEHDEEVARFSVWLLLL